MTLEQYKKKSKKIPDAPGVYFFLGKNKKVLYIGKATSLRDRTRSYFGKDVAQARGPLIVEMVAKAASVDWRQTDSVLEALLLEASLIRAHKPKYNSIQKDDKSFNHVVITKEDYPRVLVVRGKELESLRKTSPLRRDIPRSSAESFAPLHVFGPFPHGLQLQQAMKLIRKIFPFRTKCVPNSGKRCFDAQIGLCPGVCTGEISKAEYRRTVRHIALLFQGKKKQLLNVLEREMRAAAKAEDFEGAARLRGQVFALTHIQDVSLIKDEYRDYAAPRAMRIEAYDVAHLRGSAAVGVMTVVEDEVPNKGEYRTFRIRTAKGGDDPGALREILSRRLGHDEWPLPRLIVVDGAAAQMNAARRVLDELGMAIPVVGVVKDKKHRPRDLRGDQAAIRGREREILLANSEAHRFAIGRHRKTSRKNLVK
jgi:excinuclease ABC subunit C